jgi:hypothetical protein
MKGDPSMRRERGRAMQMLSGLGKACVVIGVLLLTLGLVGFMFGGFV